jgi:hypothetical protein
MSHRYPGLASMLLLAAALPVSAQDPAGNAPRLELATSGEKPPASGFAAVPYVRYHLPLHLSGSAVADQDAIESSRISLDGDLGLESPSSIWEIGGRVGGWRPD